MSCCPAALCCAPVNAAGACTFLLAVYLAMHTFLAAGKPCPPHCAQGLSAGAGDCQCHSIDGLQGEADSCWAWRVHKPWRYLQLSVAAKQLHSSQAGVASGVEDLWDGASREASSDASVEMV